ncbi:MAG: dTDP-4-dehydrorhamnose reductase [Breznakibacter sp.]
MTTLITGSNGQLGSEIRALIPQYPAMRFIFTDVAELDITDTNAVLAFCTSHKVEAIINCAAYTAVDKAETDEALARRINVDGPANLAKVAAKVGAKMVHISTDYVFNGRANAPLKETDAIDPVGVYGQTKADGEKAVLSSGADAVVVRTSWLYSEYGTNFVKTIMKYGRERGHLKVVFDQVGTPTYACDLAKACLDVLSTEGEISARGDIYHYSNEGAISWFDFAHAIVELSGIACSIEPVGSKQFPTPARRPNYSVMDKARIKADFGLKVPYWRDSLKVCIEKLNE